MFTIDKNIINEITINKSRFITLIYKVTDISKINETLNNLKKEYKDATHYCYAYIIGNTKRFNDDGEPKSTAGMPILGVLENKKLDNVLAVVIRYFGGIKLGAGGLVRAYTCRIKFKYEDINNVNYILKDYKITYKEFDQEVIYEFIYEENNYPDKLDSYLVK